MPPTVFTSLTRLHGLGVRVALDSVGFGLSSLDSLRRFPFAKIKLDQRLVRVLGKPEAAAMARAIVELCSAPDMDVIADGVARRETN